MYKTITQIHFSEDIETFINIRKLLDCMFIETIIGSRAKVKILRLLLETKIAYSMEDTRKMTGLSVGVIHKTFHSLVKENLAILKKGEGKKRFYQANLDNKYAIKLSAVFEDEKNERRSIPVHIWNRLEGICSELAAKIEGIKEVMLFGSLARGELRISSDIDLFILTKDEFNDETKARAVCKKTDLKNKINPIFVTEKEWGLYQSKKSEFYESILKEGIRLI